MRGADEQVPHGQGVQVWRPAQVVRRSDVAGMCEDCRWNAVQGIRPKQEIPNCVQDDRSSRNIHRWTSRRTSTKVW